MPEKFGENFYNVIVCGGGHAGCEAALAAARMGVRTLLLTGNLDTIAQMSCNPAIGGLAKGHIVREIDALGGEMAVNSDATAIQFRLLNSSKGPAVQAPRAQCDKKAYQFRMKFILERQQNLRIFQAEVTEILAKGGKIRGVRTNLGIDFFGDAVILSTGTFLRGLLHVGSAKNEGGRMGDFSAKTLTKSLIDNGIEIQRLKTGTPARILGSSIDFSKCSRQDGDASPTLFAFYDTRCMSDFPVGNSGGNSAMFHVEHCGGAEFLADFPEPDREVEKFAPVLSFGGFRAFGCDQLACYETHTTEKTADIIKKNLGRSAMYGGSISGVGPRYCPSIEDKFVRFAGHATHRLFLEPEGRDTDEWYINGLSTSMPYDVQEDIVHSVEGLERAVIVRPAYAVEYDAAPPTQLKDTLESRIVEGLFCAGQINGTSGYEEAAGQGLVAGVNAASKVLGLAPLVMGRHESYIGVLIDDLVRKGTQEPYRMFTSRAEYRLLLNHNSAELRLLGYARRYGLVAPGRLEKMSKKRDDVDYWVGAFEKSGMADSLRRGVPSPALPDSFNRLSKSARDEVLYRVIYKGYLERDLRQIEKMGTFERVSIPGGIDYSKVSGLRLEAAQKFARFKPATVGQAMRISGVSPADVNVLLVYIKAFKG